MAGIYIHIPFCRQACTYCNFHFSTSMEQKPAVIKAIQKEIMLPTDFIDPAEEIQTIYFGGGTPSLLSHLELSEIIETIYKKFNVITDAEVTLEVNPDNVDAVTLLLWKNMGINRLSVGVQSFNEKELSWMNRAHTAAQSYQCLDAIHAAGYTNFSVDLIYGSPLQDNDDFRKNVEVIFNYNVPHISCYALTVEPKTALASLIRQNKSLPVNNDMQSDQFLLLMQMMRSAGYEHYEISNFAQPGMRSLHNSSYWKGVSYYGFGPSAHSFNGLNTRRWNVSNNALYVAALQKSVIPFSEEHLTDVQRLNEYMMIALRTMEGIDLEKVKLLFGDDYCKKLTSQSFQFIDAGKMMNKNAALILTDDGKLIGDGITAALFFN